MGGGDGDHLDRAASHRTRSGWCGFAHLPTCASGDSPTGLPVGASAAPREKTSGGRRSVTTAAGPVRVPADHLPLLQPHRPQPRGPHPSVPDGAGSLRRVLRLCRTGLAGPRGYGEPPAAPSRRPGWCPTARPGHRSAGCRDSRGISPAWAPDGAPPHGSPEPCPTEPGDGAPPAADGARPEAVTARDPGALPPRGFTSARGSAT
jgi:hypothetical protein